MCGRFSQSERPERLAEMFGAELDPDLDLAALDTGKYNTAPTDSIRIVVEHDGRRLLTAAEWGFRPFWLDRPTGARNNRRHAGWINAKAETAFESNAFGPALRNRRCVIPADAFYEWRRDSKPPQPYAIGPANAASFGFAGIWTDASRANPATAAILTVGANGTIAPLHHRMPVLLDDLDTWLDADAPLEVIASLMQPAPNDAVRIWPVSTAVNSVRNDGPHLLDDIRCDDG
jgi:putative SOS response-associated peptidase YedK